MKVRQITCYFALPPPTPPNYRNREKPHLIISVKQDFTLNINIYIKYSTQDHSFKKTIFVL